MLPISVLSRYFGASDLHSPGVAAFSAAAPKPNLRIAVTSPEWRGFRRHAFEGSTAAMRIHGIINRRAGTLIGTDPDAFAERLKAEYIAAGHELSLAVVEPGEIGARLEEAAKQGYD